MDDSIELPVGKLTEVRRDWDFRGGWVRAPLREIVCNDRLTRQARIVWLWLMSVENQTASWGECETLLRCGTKTRRNCLSQLVQEGYIKIHDNGVVDINNPYQVFDEKRKEIIDEFRESLSSDIELITEIESRVNSYNSVMVMEKKIDKANVSAAKENKAKPATSTSLQKDQVIDSWNKSKPDNYSKIRTVSQKQLQCIGAHLKNLGLKNNEADIFIQMVCNGLKKSEFWSVTVNQSGRNFNSVFGYGIPQDTKMKNIESLYSEGQEESKPAVVIPQKISADQQELIDAFKYSKMNLENARAREDEREERKWQKHVSEIEQQLLINNISVDGI